jgi:hypothetical protein
MGILKPTCVYGINRNFGGVDGSWRIGSEKVEVKSEKQEKRPVFCFFLTPHSSLLTFPISLLTLCRRSCANRDPEQRHLGVQLICEASSLFQRWHIHVAYPEDAPSWSMCADDRFLCQRYPVLWIPASAGMTLKGLGEAHSTKIAIDPFFLSPTGS